jgi:hypothetical protein
MPSWILTPRASIQLQVKRFLWISLSLRFLLTGLLKMPIPAGANMGGPSTVDKCKLPPLSALEYVLIQPLVKMGAMMGGSKQEGYPVLLVLGRLIYSAVGVIIGFIFGMLTLWRRTL